MKSKLIDVTTAVSKIKDNDTILFGGFYAIGTPINVIDELLRQGQKNLIVVSNDGGLNGVGVYHLIDAGRVDKLICSFCGPTPSVYEAVQKGELELELVPQGSLAERIRAGGYGLGGILTPTGLGTMVEENWGQRVNLNGKDWLYQTPIRGNISFVEADEGDEFGNLIFKNSQRNFCTVIPYASDIVIAAVTNPIKKAGSLDPNRIMVPGAVVDYIIQQEV